MKRASDGFTLLEVLVAMVIGLFLIGGVYSTFIGQQEAFVTQNAVLEIQQNVRFVNQMLGREIRNAGYGMAGVSLGGTGGVDLGNTRPFVFRNNNVGQTITLSGGGSVPIDDKTDSFDIMTTRFVTTLSATYNCTAATSKLSDASQFETDDILLMSNGADANFFQVTNVNYNNNQVNHNFGQSKNINLPGGKQKQICPGYSAGDRVYEVFWYTYFVSNGNLLRVRYGSNQPEVIAYNIEDMQLAFGLDTVADNVLAVDTWDDGGGIDNRSLTTAQLDQIRDVRVTLVAKSTDQVRNVEGRSATAVEDHDPASDSGYNATDYKKFLRRVTSNTVQARNYGI